MKIHNKNYQSKTFGIVFGIVISMFMTQTVFAAGEKYTGRSAIYVIESGWGADTYSVKLVNDTSSGTYTNPAGCSAPQAGYVTSTTDPGRRLYQDQLREAFFSFTPVKLLIHPTDCPFNKPRIIAVQICHPDTVKGLNC